MCLFVLIAKLLVWLVAESMDSDPSVCLTNAMVCVMVMMLFETDKFARSIDAMKKRLFLTVLNAVKEKKKQLFSDKKIHGQQQE